MHLPGSNPQPSLLLAFEYKGGWTDVKGAVAMTVLTYLLGGGNSFSSGERQGQGFMRGVVQEGGLCDLATRGCQ